MDSTTKKWTQGIRCPKVQKILDKNIILNWFGLSNLWKPLVGFELNTMQTCIEHN